MTWVLLGVHNLHIVFVTHTDVHPGLFHAEHGELHPHLIPSRDLQHRGRGDWFARTLFTMHACHSPAYTHKDMYLYFLYIQAYEQHTQTGSGLRNAQVLTRSHTLQQKHQQNKANTKYRSSARAAAVTAPWQMKIEEVLNSLASVVLPQHSSHGKLRMMEEEVGGGVTHKGGGPGGGVVLQTLMVHLQSTAGG